MRKNLVFCLLFGFAVLLSRVSCYAQAVNIDVRDVKTPNGIGYWYVKEDDLPIVSVTIAFKQAGYAYDTREKQGLASLATSVLSRAAVGDGKGCAQRFRERGMKFAFSVDLENAYISLKTLAVNLELAFSMLSDCLLNVKISDEFLASEKERQKVAIRRLLSEPRALAEHAAVRLVLGEHPYAYRSLGELETVDKITVDDILHYVGESFDLDQMVLGVVGRVRERDVSVVLDKYLSRLPKGQNLKSIDDADLAIGKRGYVRYDVPQSIVVFTAKGLSFDDPRYYAVKLLNHALGGTALSSVLMKELREKMGITYHVGSLLRNEVHANFLLGILYTDSSTVSQGVDAFLKVVKSVKTRGLDEQAFDIAKSDIMNSFMFSLLSTSDIAGLLVGLQLEGRDVNYISDYRSKFESIKLQDVNAVAKDFWDAFSIVEVGAKNNIGGEVIA